MAYFRPMARIISHLGERLISSSKVALLELIKNSYDAKSPYVEITIDQSEKRMIIYDEGDGMDKQTIEDYWLVVGTNHRLSDREDSIGDDVPLGEKGLGRFSTMKLGEYLHIKTSREFSSKIWSLEIDWKKYGYKSTLFLDEIDNRLYSTRKINGPDKFTEITINGLKDFISDEWNEFEVHKFVTSTALKYTNPFIGLPRKFEIRMVLINKNKIKKRWKIGEADQLLFSQAHHEIEGKYKPGELEMTYVIRREGKVVDTKNEKTIIDKRFDVFDMEEEGYVGPFSFHFYVFNRTIKRLKEIKGYETTDSIRKILDVYTGGPMIFRDGFRIFPYGEAGDDWLLLNRNRYRKGKIAIVGEQTAGFIALDSRKSPFLVDQTNREGLVDNKSFENFKEIIKQVFTTLVSRVESNDPRETSTGIIASAKISAINIEKFITQFKSNGLVNEKDVKLIINEAKSIEKGINNIRKREQALIETAAVGMTSMQIAHEIHNFINKILAVLDDLNRTLPKESKSKTDILQLNLKSLRTMVSQIDEQSATLRRAKASIDLVSQLREIARAMQPVASESVIPIKINVTSYTNKFIVKVNKGLLIQLFDNLILNSIYWIDSAGTCDRSNIGNIDIHINEDVVEFVDNGPGIAQIDAEAVFEPFFSRRKNGRGLGLFIAREIAAFHNINLELSTRKNSMQRYHKFNIDFSKVKGE